MFVWTPTLDALAPPVRGAGLLVEPQQMGWRRIFKSALVARAVGYEPRESLVRFMTTGVGDDHDEADAFLLACSAPRRGTGIGKVSGLSEAEALRVAHAGVDRWVQLHGLAKAIERFAWLGVWKPTPLFPDAAVRIMAAKRLRHWIARASDSAYEAALAFVQHWGGLPHGMKAWPVGVEPIAYLFPDHRPYFRRAADDVVETSLLLGAIASVDEYRSIESRLGEDDVDRNALHVARVLGDDALPLLLAMPRVAGVAVALTAFDAPEAAAALAQFAARRELHGVIREYFTRHPMLVAHLEQRADDRDSRLRSGAKVLLSSL